MIQKRMLRPDRVRRPPREGFSWIDRRFLREHAPFLSREAILTYFFLTAVSDKSGLSFYGDATTAAVLRLEPSMITMARSELVCRDLIAMDPPLIQVLALPPPERTTPKSGPQSLGKILRGLAEGKP